MRISTLIFSCIITCLLTTSAFAHRVNIFAWIEGSTVYTESFFSSGNKAQSSTIRATDKNTGKVLAEGKTNTNGEWSFPLSAEAVRSKDPIVITLDAGQGHASTWTLEAQDFVDSSMPSTTSATPAKSPAASNTTTSPTTSSTSETVTITKAELETIVRTAVQQELVHVKGQLAKLNAQILQPETTVKDIFGGLGYILGLLGLAAFIQYRKRQ